MFHLYDSNVIPVSIWQIDWVAVKALSLLDWISLVVRSLFPTIDGVRMFVLHNMHSNGWRNLSPKQTQTSRQHSLQGFFNYLVDECCCRKYIFFTSFDSIFLVNNIWEFVSWDPINRKKPNCSTKWKHQNANSDQFRCTADHVCLSAIFIFFSVVDKFHFKPITQNISYLCVYNYSSSLLVKLLSCMRFSFLLTLKINNLRWKCLRNFV